MNHPNQHESASVGGVRRQLALGSSRLTDGGDTPCWHWDGRQLSVVDGSRVDVGTEATSE